MTPPVLTFFNNKGGVGKTSLLYHLAWMFADLDKRVVAVDLDPQSNLTAAFLDEERIESLWNDNTGGATIFHAVKPLTGIGDIAEPKIQKITDNLYLIPGDVGLSSYEDTLSKGWSESLDDDNLYRPMRILSSFWQVMQMAANQVEADIILVDIEPNLGAINRSVLIATDYVMIPLSADFFSLRSIPYLGSTLKSWNESWQLRLNHYANACSNQSQQMHLPSGKAMPIGYLCPISTMRGHMMPKIHQLLLERIHNLYKNHIIDQTMNDAVQDDEYCLGLIKNYRSLAILSQEHRKPIFKLTAADGAIGSHAAAVQDARRDFQALANKIAEKIGL